MGFTHDQQEQLINVCKQLGTKPKFDAKEDLENWMKSYVASMADTKPSIDVEVKDKPSTLQKELIPRVPNLIMFLSLFGFMKCNVLLKKDITVKQQF